MTDKPWPVLPDVLDAALIIHPANRRYLSGFTGSNGTLLITKNHRYLFTDSRYTELAENQSPTFEIIIQNRNTEKLEDLIQTILVRQSVKKLGFEASVMPVEMFNKFSKQFLGIKMIPNDGWVETLRSVKDKTEIGLIKEACNLTDLAYQQILTKLTVGMSEMEAAVELDYIIGKLGAGRGFNILLSGANSSMPHGEPSPKKIEHGDFVLMDFGLTVDGYHSDMTRTVVMGDASPKQRAVYNLVLRSQLEGLKTLGPGIQTNIPHITSREIILNSSYGHYVFDYGIGHGIGLFIHEAPFMREDSDQFFKPGNVLTIEPGIYIPGWGGVRIEDDVLITKDGFDILTQSSKELLIL